MKETRNIFGWLAMQQEQSILADARKHIAEVKTTVENFAEAIRAFIAGDLQTQTAAIEKVKESEHRADLQKVMIIDHLTKGILHPPDREDLFAFVKAIDSIANRTKTAAKLLAFIEQPPPHTVLKNISAATEQVVNAMGVLTQTIDAAIRNDLDLALEQCKEIVRIEHIADDQKSMLLEAIFHAELSPQNLLLCYHLADRLEDVTDKIRDSVNFIKMIVIRSK